MLIKDEARLLPLEELGEQRFPLLNRLAAQILTVQFKQIERAMNHTGERAVAADQVKQDKGYSRPKRFASPSNRQEAYA